MRWLSLIIAFLLTIAGSAQAPIIRTEKIKPNVVKVSGVSDAVISPGGGFMAFQSASTFVVFPFRDLGKVLDSPGGLREYPGEIIGFLPSDTLIFFNTQGIFALDPSKHEPERLFSLTVGKHLTEDFDRSLRDSLVISNDLIIAGDGSYDWGGKMGNIYRYDLRNRRMTRAAKVPMFWHAALSPSRRYVLYEHGAEDNNNTDIYDILRNRNHAISDYFDFKKNFPGLRVTDETPVVWLTNRDVFLAQVSPGGEIDNEGWLVLFDLPNRKVIWKTPLEKWFFPTDFQQLDPANGLFASEDGIFEISLADGKIRKHPNLKGNSIAVSPDGKRVATVEGIHVYISASDGSGRFLLCDLPAGWKPQTEYKGMGERPPLWSGDGEMLILFGEDQLLLVQITGSHRSSNRFSKSHLK